MDDILDLFFQITHCTYLRLEKDKHLRKELWGWAEKELTRATSYDMETLDPILEAAATFTESCYPLASNEMKFSMSKGTASIVSLDSFLIHPRVQENLAESQKRLVAGLEPLDDFSAAYSTFTKEAAQLYGSINPLVGMLASNGWNQHLEGWCLEGQMQDTYRYTQSGGGSSQSLRICQLEDFPYYLRSITGVPIPYIIGIFKPTRELEVPYTLWMSCFPALKVFACLTNDLFSYPKELLAGERFNYMNIQTKTKQDAGCKSQFVENMPWTFRDTLYETVTRAANCVHAINEVFLSGLSGTKSDGPVRGPDYEFQLGASLWSLFKQGYMSWHIRCPRYKLDGLLSRFENCPPVV
ncbi:hypothetical protein NUU61_003913 [Penicillium alfredii]|uniref:Terpene synthase n=1 Tax=Penicillium alfredii TaxID=1506179 RepID=A0A9W9FK34_9EURO|nr:uncharacterized protein NUU61_003913 [Penicillium alfredii]KAJ5101691.1 hypothetical protein NUU61_003913 [Penicillium alfredii]